MSPVRPLATGVAGAVGIVVVTWGGGFSIPDRGGVDGQGQSADPWQSEARVDHPDAAPPLGMRLLADCGIPGRLIVPDGSRWVSAVIPVPDGFNHVSVSWPTAGREGPRIRAFWRSSIGDGRWANWQPLEEGGCDGDRSAGAGRRAASVGPLQPDDPTLRDSSRALSLLQLALEMDPTAAGPEGDEGAPDASTGLNDVVRGLEVVTATVGSSAMPPPASSRAPTPDSAFRPADDAGEPGAIPAPAIVSRTAWGCPDGQGSRWTPVTDHDVRFLVVHHSAGANAAADWAAVVQSIWVFHAITRDWGDVGYNYLIDPRGVIYEGRAGGDDAIGAHFSCANRGTMGVCMLGNFESATPTDAALRSLVHLLAWKAERAGLDPEGAGWHEASGLALETISGHRDANPSANPDACPSGTVCPGTQLYPLLPTVRADVGRLLSDHASGLAVLSLAETALDVASWTGNGDDSLDAGESAGLALTVRNDGIGTATDMTATLATRDPWIAVIDAEQPYPDIAPGEARDEIGDFDLAVSPNCPGGHVAKLELTLSGPWGAVVLPVTLQVVSGVVGPALADWLRSHLGDASAAAPNALAADPDGDGIPNLLEFATATDPLHADATSIRIEYRPTADDSPDILLHHRRADSVGSTSNVALAWEWSPDLQPASWSSVPPAALTLVSASSDPEAPEVLHLTHRLLPPAATWTFRLRASLVPGVSP